MVSNLSVPWSPANMSVPWSQTTIQHIPHYSKPSVRVGRHFSASPNNVKDVSSTCRVRHSEFPLARTNADTMKSAFAVLSRAYTWIFSYFPANASTSLHSCHTKLRRTACTLTKIVCSLLLTLTTSERKFICWYVDMIIIFSIIRVLYYMLCSTFIWARLFYLQTHTHTLASFVALSYFRKCLIHSSVVRANERERERGENWQRRRQRRLQWRWFPVPLMCTIGSKKCMSFMHMSRIRRLEHFHAQCSLFAGILFENEVSTVNYEGQAVCVGDARNNQSESIICILINLPCDHSLLPSTLHTGAAKFTFFCSAASRMQPERVATRLFFRSKPKSVQIWEIDSKCDLSIRTYWIFIKTIRFHTIYFHRSVHTTVLPLWKGVCIHSSQFLCWKIYLKVYFIAFNLSSWSRVPMP